MGSDVLPEHQLAEVKVELQEALWEEEKEEKVRKEEVVRPIVALALSVGTTPLFVEKADQRFP